MSGRESTRKGAQLERVISSLQEAVQALDLPHTNRPYKITRNVRKEVDGVTYEIDLWVESDPDAPQRVLHLIECKNWSRPVSHKEVVALADKVRVFGATQGTLFAPKFSSGAQRKAEAENITLGRVEESILHEACGLQTSAAVHDILNLKATFHFADVRPNRPSLTSETSQFFLGGRQFDLHRFLEPSLRACVDALWRADNRMHLEGNHSDPLEFLVPLGPEEMSVNGEIVERLHVSALLQTKVTLPRGITSWLVAGLGQHIIADFPPNIGAIKELQVSVNHV